MFFDADMIRNELNCCGTQNHWLEKGSVFLMLRQGKAMRKGKNRYGLKVRIKQNACFGTTPEVTTWQFEAPIETLEQAQPVALITSFFKHVFCFGGMKL